MVREIPEDLHSSHSAEKHVRMVLAMKTCEGPNTLDTAERLMMATGHIFDDVMANFHAPDLALPQEWLENHPTPSVPSDSSGGNKGSGPHRHELSNEFMTVGDAGTLRHPRFLRTVTVEFRQVTDDCATVDWCHGTRHGDVPIGEPREPGLQFSSRSRLRAHCRLPWHVVLGSGLPTQAPKGPPYVL